MKTTKQATPSLLDRVKRFLVDEGYRPGDRVEPELRLAKRFKTPRAKIREVLTSLCQQGLLERSPRSGTVIRELDSHQIGENLQFRFRMAGLDEADAAEARRIIEPAILPLAVRRITPTQLRRLRELVEEMEQNLDDPKRADAADREFHLHLLQCCGNRTLMLFGGVIQGLFGDAYRKRFRHRELLKAAAAEHRRLLGAISKDDTDTALELMKKHLSHYED